MLIVDYVTCGMQRLKSDDTCVKVGIVGINCTVVLLSCSMLLYKIIGSQE